SLLALKQMPMQGVYSFSRLNRYYGKFLRHGLEYPDIKPRLFPKDIVRWNENPVHETPEYSSPQKITRLDGFLLHYTFHNIEEQVHTMNRYSSLGAQLNREKGKKASVWRIVFNPLHTFIRAYFFKRG